MSETNGSLKKWLKLPRWWVKENSDIIVFGGEKIETEGWYKEANFFHHRKRLNDSVQNWSTKNKCIIILFRHMEETVRTKNRSHYSGCFHCLWPSQVALVVKNLSANPDDIRDVGWIPGSGRSPGGGHSNSLRYSCLEKPMDRGAWWATVHGLAQSRTLLKRFSTHACISYG